MRAVLFLLLVGCSSSSNHPTCIEPDGGLPTDLACTGLYENGDVGTYATTAMPYTPGVTLWSDGAEKHRYLYLPTGSTIDTSVLDEWKFPIGTKAWKEFVVDGVLVETRLFSKRADDLWDHGTYVWATDGKSATLNTDPHGIILPSGYEIPTIKDCDKCHDGGADRLLGVEAVALALPTAEGATLTKLVGMGALSDPPPVTTVTLPDDATGKAATALGFLHANCGMPCHSSRGLGDETQLVMRLRADELGFGLGPAKPATQTDTYLATVGQMPTTASVAQQFPGQLRITAGQHDQSVVWQLAHRRGLYQMPPLVSHVIDEDGTAKLAEWIDALPPP
ncbi:MAG TPA: hypothetical protein VGM90_33655 [Kofleriaceae bacterium]|jgi:hypothetical protein